jgi:hypothetical protein
MPSKRGYRPLYVLLIAGTLAAVAALAVARGNRLANSASAHPDGTAAAVATPPNIERPSIIPAPETPRRPVKPRRDVNGYPALDGNHVYAAGEQVKVEEPHGVYSGWISMDGKVFLRPVRFNENQLVGYVRPASRATWSKVAFVYRCDNFELKLGQIELGYLRKTVDVGDPPAWNLQVGKGFALCVLDPLDKPEGN